MREITWYEIFFTNKSLKTLRKEYDLQIPNEYIISTSRFAFAGMICMFVLGLIIGWLL